MACITLAYNWFVGTQSDHMGSMHPEIAPIRWEESRADARFGLTTTSRRTARNSLPMNYFSRFHVHAGSRMVDAGAQTCTWSPVPRPVHRDRDPGPESRDARQFSLSARWGTLASSRSRAVAREAAGPKWRRRRGCSACGAFQPLEGRSRSVRFRRHRSYKGCAVSMLKGKTNIEPASEVVRSSRPP